MTNSAVLTLLVIGLWAMGAAAESQPDVAPNTDVQIRPQIKYEAHGRRDPFVKPMAGQLQNVVQNVDIETLRLTGVIRNARQAVALFASQTGPKFGFLLKNGKLYRENHQTVPGISGKVVNPEKVILKQGEKQIVFKLRAK